MWHLADVDAGGWVAGPDVDAMGKAVTCVGVAANGWAMAHLVNDDCGRWAVDGLDAESVGCTVTQGITVADGWIANCHSTVGIWEGVVGGFDAEATGDEWVDGRGAFVAGCWLVDCMAVADAEGGDGLLLGCFLDC